ncbi:MAG: gliding motility-associated C-terminal domain-containing protein [Ignavibacteria bacterium]|nr:gliding motility-associated C-terminal domain-containing protein [Ignavibacteria bacterium]
MKTLLTIFVACILFSSHSTAQKLEDFSALSGIAAAREKVAQLGLNKDAKLVFIDKVTTTSPSSIYYWNYIFSYNHNSSVVLISVSKENAKYIATVKDKAPSLTEYIEIPDYVLDSNYPFKEVGPYLEYCSLTSLQNLHFSIPQDKEADSANRFVWFFEVTNKDPDYIGDGYYLFSAITGEMLDSKILSVPETPTQSDKYFTLYPNPSSGEITFSESYPYQPSPDPSQNINMPIPVSIKIYNLLGNSIFQTNIIGDHLQGYQFNWDGKSNGDVVAIGTYYAMITVRSQTKRVPFAIVR